MSRFPFAVLGTLSKRSLSGYDVHNTFTHAVRSYWTETLGRIYPLLEQLLTQGLIEVDEQTPHRSQLKTTYKLTPAGLEKLEAWMETAPTPCEHQDEVALRVSFGAVTHPSIILGLLEAETEHVRDQLDELDELDIEQLDDFEFMAYRWSRRYLEARAQWVDESARELNDYR